MTARPSAPLSLLALSALMLAYALFTSSPVAASPDMHRVLELTNQNRRAAGCKDLAFNPALAVAAQRHADDMAAHNYFSHVSQNGAKFTDRILAAGYRWKLAAENLAAGQDSPDEVVASWMASPPHRANLLNCRLKEVGMGFAFNDASTYGSYWVQNFGTARR